MKLKIKITGPKIHGVGYRNHLMYKAYKLELPRFDAENQIENGQQQVIALVEGDEDAVVEFKKFAETSCPENAELPGTSVSDYKGRIIDIGAYAQFFTSSQFHIAIPILLDIRADLNAVKNNTDMIPQMAGDIKEMKANTALTPQILEEIRGLREDQPNHAMRQLQQNMAAVKARLNIP